MSKVSHKTGSGAGTKIHTTSALGHVVPLHHVVSTDSSDWNIYKNRPVKEEVEQVDELRTSTLLRYAIKANNSLIGGDRSKEEKRIKSIQKANYKIQTRHKVKEDVEQQDEAWTQGNRNPQRGVKVGDKVRSYDFPGMHDDHYIEGHVVADNPHTYHIRVNKVVRSGKEIPVPAHMQHVEAPKGKGMFSNAYAVHKMMAKQQSVTPAPEPAKGADKTFRGMRDRLREGAGPWGKISASALEKIKKAQEKERRLAARNPGALTKTAAPSRKKADKKYYDYLAKEKP
jgi:hypothetical protein